MTGALGAGQEKDGAGSGTKNDSNSMNDLKTATTTSSSIMPTATTTGEEGVAPHPSRVSVEGDAENIPAGGVQAGAPQTLSRKRKQEELEQAAEPADRGSIQNEAMIKSIVACGLESEDDNSVAKAMEKLCEMVTASSKNDNFDENRKTLFQCKAPLAIVKAMSRCEASPLIQRDGCSALAALCFQKADNARQHILDIGGLDCCIRALNKCSGRHGDGSPSLQAAGCNLIGSLWLQPDVRKSTVDKGGLAAVLKAMENHQQSELVQSVGCEALFTLLHLESIWDKVAVPAGSIEAVIAAMENHASVIDLQIAACQFLIVPSPRHEDCRNLIIEAKGLGAAVEAGRIHKNNGRVVCVARNAVTISSIAHMCKQTWLTACA